MIKYQGFKLFSLLIKIFKIFYRKKSEFKTIYFSITPF